MAEVRHISVSTQKLYMTRTIFMQIIVWGWLVGAESVSHLWFGGSWVIDLMVLFIMVILLIKLGTERAGVSVVMTPNEIRAWVNAGMPLDVKAWKAGADAKPVN